METKLRILDKVNNSNDLKTLSNEELTILADEMRELIIKKVNTTGGHFGPNLGIVEMTVAMHRVFNSPVDKFVFDVFDREMQHRNRLILSANKNLMFLMFMNNKYIIGENVNIYGYKEEVV